MDLICATNNDGRPYRIVDYDADFQVGENENSFVISAPYSDYIETADNGIDIIYPKRINAGDRVYVRDYDGSNEYGGIVDGVEIQTEFDQVIYSGYTWRGLLTKNFVIPTGTDGYYHSLAGDANKAIDDLLTKFFKTKTFYGKDLFKLNGSALSGITVKSHALRYNSLYDALFVILSDADVAESAYPRIRYIEYETTNDADETYMTGGFQVYAEEVEWEDRYLINNGNDNGGIDAVYTRTGLHQELVVIGLGAGELTSRIVIYTYLDPDTGNVTYTKDINSSPLGSPLGSGVMVISDVMDYSSAEEDELFRSCKERFYELSGADNIEVTPRGKLNTRSIGDNVSFENNQIGVSMPRNPITGKIWRRSNMEENEQVIVDASIGGGGERSSGGGGQEQRSNWVNKTVPEYDLMTTAGSGTLDGDLYAAITALGWQSEVIA